MGDWVYKNANEKENVKRMVRHSKMIELISWLCTLSTITANERVENGMYGRQ